MTKALGITKLFEITGEDGFFLTFIAAWISVRFSQFNKGVVIDLNWPLLILLCGILGLSIFVSQLRFWISKRSLNKATGVLLGFGILQIIVNIYYFGWYNTTYLDTADIFAFYALGFMWAFSPFMSYLANYVMAMKINIKLENTNPPPPPIGNSMER